MSEKKITEDGKLHQIKQLTVFYNKEKAILEKFIPLSEVYKRDFQIRNHDLFQVLNTTMIKLHEELMLYVVAKHDEVLHHYDERIIPLRPLPTPFNSPPNTPTNKIRQSDRSRSASLI